MISRYDAESDILYLVIKEGEIKDTVEVSEDMFIEYDENDNLVGIELWRARKNVLGEFMKYINTISKISSYWIEVITINTYIFSHGACQNPMQPPCSTVPMQSKI